MISELWRYPRALMLSVLFHVGLLSILFVSMNFSEQEKLIKQGERVKTVKAQIVDQQQLEASKKKKQQQLETEKRKEKRVKKKGQEKNLLKKCKIQHKNLFD